MTCRPSGTYVEPTGMERTHKCALAENAIRKGAASVRTCGLGRKNGAITAAKNCNRDSVRFEYPALAHGNSVDGSKIGVD